MALFLVAGHAPAFDLLSAAPVTAQAKVVIVHNSQATETFEPRPDIARQMVDQAVVAVTGRSNAAAAWGSLVKPQDIVGIKVFASSGAMAGTRPAVAAAVVEGLLAAHVPRTNIIIWDRRRTDLLAAGYDAIAKEYGVRLGGSVDSGYDDKVFYDSPLLGRLLSGDLEFGAGEDVLARKSHVTRLVTGQLTRIINISPLLNNYDAGVVGNLFSLTLGSVDNTRRFEGSTDSLARAIPEIYALQAVGDKVVLSITDALICQYEGGDNVRLHNSTVLNEIRMSRDPVALDVLSVNELEAQRLHAGFPPANTNSFDIYKNATLLELGVSDTTRIQPVIIR